jgi:molybdopterin-guanine dinucleotide biosynthesis protein A
MPTSDRPPLSAAVLAGGLSTRMGTDKALLPLRPGDPPLGALVVQRLRAVAGDVFVVTPDRPGYDALGARLVPDAYPGAAALGGIATALEAATHGHCLVVACDLPFLNPRLLRWLADQPRDYDVLIPRLPGESRQGRGAVFQTLHAVYGKGCLPAIRRRLAEADLRVVGFFDEVLVREVTVDEVRSLDPELRSFFNANTPEAAAEARRLLDAERPPAVPDEPLG